MLSRRSFLSYATATTITLPFLAGCNANPALKVMLLNESIPPRLLAKFRRTIPGISLKFEPEAELRTLYELLEAWQQPEAVSPRSFWQKLPFWGQNQAEIAQLITLGNYWFQDAIAANWIQPLPVATLPHWSNLPTRLQDFVKRNPKGERDLQGQAWGAPYRFGSTVMVYNRRKFAKLGWTPQDWQDLWQPDLKNRIAIINQPREVIGLTLKKLGYSYNEANLEAIPDLEAELQALNQQIKFYSSTHYLQPLILEDVWLAVGWSNDILSIQKRYPELEVVVPASGTAIWLDLWVQPAAAMQAASPELWQKWLDFCWQEDAAWEISLWTQGLSPLLLTAAASQLPEDLKENAFIRRSLEVFPQSDIIEPLAASVSEQYKELWQKIRNAERNSNKS
jgi:putative spermidine/putrescine transport system substrate-binding protein